MLIQLLGNLWLAAKLALSMAPHARYTAPHNILAYSIHIVEASIETGLDPHLIAAVMWKESDFRNLPRSPTDDYGLMQVHWQPRVKWLRGLTPEDLMDPRTNVLVGARELEAARRFCLGKGHSQDDHYWWGHYKWGLVVRSPKYAQNVLWRHRALSRSARPGT